MKEFIIDNYTMFFVLIGMLIILKISVHVDRRVKVLTLLAIILLVIQTIMFNVEHYTQTFDHLSILRPLLTAGQYSIYPIILLVFMNIIIDNKTSKAKLLLLLIPEFICIPLFFTSQWTKIVVYFTEDNHYKGGPLSFLPFALFTFYAIVFLANNIYFFKKFAKMNRLIVEYIIIGSLLGVFAYKLLDAENDYTELFSVALLSYYLNFYIHMARIDTLTNLLNRQCYYQDMRHYDERICAVMSIDMNELKYINDNFGHVAGDEALRTISKIIGDNCGKNGIAYRVGGDEFMVFYLNNKPEHEIVEAIGIMKIKLSETQYSCAFGYQMKAKNDNLEEIIAKADNKMYEEKRIMKAQAIEDGKEIHIR